jgi:NADH:ubiquinone oxidoreductase subunit 3 (subunit A)
MVSSYGIVLVFLVGGIFFILFAFFLAWLFRANGLFGKKNLPNALTDTYECGMEAIGTPWVRFTVSFYLYALLFVIFDIETVFLYPWAVTFRTLGFYGFAAIMLFILLLALGLAYAWKKGGLRWE